MNLEHKVGKLNTNICVYIRQDFPGGLGIKTPASTAGGMGLIPAQVIKIPHAVWCGQKKNFICVWATTSQI